MPDAFHATLDALHDHASFVEELLSNPDALGWHRRQDREHPRISYGCSADDLKAYDLDLHRLASREDRRARSQFMRHLLPVTLVKTAALACALPPNYQRDNEGNRSRGSRAATLPGSA